MLDQDTKDRLAALWLDLKSNMSKIVIGAIIAALAIIGGTLIEASHQLEAPSPTAPASLPTNTGIDGQGIVEGKSVDQVQPDGLPDQLTAEQQDQVVPVPQALSSGNDGKNVQERAPPEASDGIGGSVYLKAPVWDGEQRLNAGKYYPSGSFHGAWDIGIKRGTKVYAPLAGKVVGLNDGVPNQPIGVIRGSDSNWVLTCHKLAGGREATVYYQHGSPGVPVKRGQQVKAGQLVLRSGNTGNSTGDHLHLAAQWLRSGVTCATMTQSQARQQRYDYLNLGNTRIFEPSLVWTKFKPGSSVVTRTINAPGLAKIARNKGKSNRVVWVRKNLRVTNKTNQTWTWQLTRDYAKYQRALGYRGRAADGIPGCASLKVLGKRTPVKWSTKC